jgi:membrane protein
MKSKQRASWGSSGRISIRDYFSSLISRFEKDNVTILASGMVYSTLIALVPCITFFMFFFSVLGVLDPFLQVLSDFLVEVFGSRTGNTISQAITSMTKNAGTMGAFGMVSFIVTFLFLINKFWTVVNKIYRTSVEQNQFKKFLTFLVVLIIGTILMGAFLSLKTKFSDWYSTVFQITPLADGQKVLEWFVSKTVIWAVLFCLMMSVPNTTVRASAALISSALVTVAIVLLDWLFSFATKQMVSYSIIYGSLGVVFVFLLWIFILWMIVFMGFESCFVIQFRPSTKEKKASATPLNQISDVIAMMTYIGSR